MTGITYLHETHHYFRLARILLLDSVIIGFRNWFLEEKDQGLVLIIIISYEHLVGSFGSHFGSFSENE